MKAEASLMPEQVKIENLGETSDVIITENVETIISDNETSYRYDEYRINIISRDNLLESVTNSLEMWLDFAKQATPVTPNDTKRIDRLEETQSKVVDTLASALGVIL